MNTVNSVYIRNFLTPRIDLGFIKDDKNIGANDSASTIPSTDVLLLQGNRGAGCAFYVYSGVYGYNAYIINMFAVYQAVLLVYIKQMQHSGFSGTILAILLGYGRQDFSNGIGVGNRKPLVDYANLIKNVTISRC